MRNLLNKAFEFLKGLYLKNPGVFISASVFLALFGIAAIYLSVELTSTPAFCASCHEMKQAEKSWKESKHFNVPKGKKQASCRDCHLPPWTKPVELLWSKAFHGAKDVTAHFTRAKEMKYPGFYFDMKAHAGRTISNASCLKCHSDIFTKKYEKYENIHRSIRENRAMKCYQCHEGIAHKEYLPEGM